VPRRALLAALAVAALLSVSACGEESADTAKSSGGGKPTVCLVMKSLANEFFQDMLKGAKAHVAERGDLTLDASGTQNETDVDGQVALMDKCITNQVQAIVLAPADSKALVQSVVRADQAGIKVVNIDVRLDQGALEQAGVEVPYVGPDNRAGARESGMVLAKQLGDGAKVALLEGNPGADNAAQRKQGFLDAVKEGGLNLVSSKTAHWETDEAHTVFSNMLTADPGIKGVLASNDSMALGALKVIEERHADVKVASFDNIPAIKPYLTDGKVVATLDQFGSKQAADGIDYAMQMIDGKKVAGWQKTGIKLVTEKDLG
jgi:ribose transport system substrate-binding protein